MIGTLLSDKTPADVRLNAPIESVVHVPLNHPRAVFRLLTFAVVVGASAYALVTLALHFNDATFLSKIPSVGDALGSTMIGLRILQLMSAVGTLVLGVFAAMRVIALLQSREAGLSVGPRGITIACDWHHPGGRLIRWPSIAGIDVRKAQGGPSIVLRLRPPQVPDGNFSRFSWWPGSRITISARSLRAAHTDLKALLDRYFAHYATPRSPTLQEIR